MRYKTKVTVLTGGKEYKPGMVLPKDISNTDMAFLKSKKFVEPVDTEFMTDAEDYDEPEMADDKDYGEPDIEDESDIFLGFGEKELEALKSPEEILKIRSKKDVVSYAASIGLDLEDNYENRPLKDLQEEVINFQEGNIEDDV